jgi:hypothetical protein
MHTQSTNVRPRLTTHPKHGKSSLIIEFQQLTLMNSANPQLSFNGADKRRPLKQRPREILYRPRQRVVVIELVVQTEDADVLFPGGLLRFDETGCTVDAD